MTTPTSGTTGSTGPGFPSLPDAQRWYNPFKGDPSASSGDRVQYISPNDAKNAITDILKITADYIRIGTTTVGVYGYMYVPDPKTAPGPVAPPYGPFQPVPVGANSPAWTGIGSRPPYMELSDPWPLEFVAPPPGEPINPDTDWDKDPGKVDPTNPTGPKLRTTPLGWRSLGPAGGGEITISKITGDTPENTALSGHVAPDSPPKEGDVWINDADKLIWIYGGEGIGNVTGSKWWGPFGVPTGGKNGDTLVWDPTPSTGAPGGKWVLLSQYLKPAVVDALPTAQVAPSGATGASGPYYSAGKIYQLATGAQPVTFPTTGNGIQPYPTGQTGPTQAQPGMYFWLDQGGHWQTSTNEPPGATVHPGQALVWVADDPNHPTGPGQWLPGEGVPRGSQDGDILVWDPNGGPAKLGGWFVNQAGLPAKQIFGHGPSGPSGPTGMGGKGVVTLVWDPVGGPNGIGGWTPKPITPGDLYVPNIIPTGNIPASGATGPNVTPLIQDQLYRWSANNPLPSGQLPGINTPLKPGDLFWFDGTNWHTTTPAGVGVTGAQGPQGATGPTGPTTTAPTGPTAPSMIPTQVVPTNPSINQLYVSTTNAPLSSPSGSSGPVQIQPGDFFWWDGSAWQKPSVAVPTGGTGPTTAVGTQGTPLDIHIWVGPSGSTGSLVNPNPAISPVTVKPGDLYWFDGTNWHTSTNQTPPLPSIIPTDQVPSPSNATGPALATNQFYTWTPTTQSALTPTGLSGPLNQGDIYWFDGTNWHSIPKPTTGGPALPTTSSVTTPPTAGPTIVNNYYTWSGPTGGTLAPPSAGTGSTNPPVGVKPGDTFWWDGGQWQIGQPNKPIIPVTALPTQAGGPVINQFYQNTTGPLPAVPGIPSGIKPGDIFWNDGTTWHVLPTGGPGIAGPQGATGATGPAGPSIVPITAPVVGPPAQNQLYQWQGPAVPNGSSNGFPGIPGPLNPGDLIWFDGSTWQVFPHVANQPVTTGPTTAPSLIPTNGSLVPPSNFTPNQLYSWTGNQVPSGSSGFTNGLLPNDLFWFDGTNWHTVPKTPPVSGPSGASGATGATGATGGGATPAMVPDVYYVWSGPSQVLNNPDKTKPPVTVHDGDIFWWSATDNTWHTGKVPPVLPSGGAAQLSPNTGDFLYFGVNGWSYGKPQFDAGTLSSLPPQFGSLPVVAVPSGPTNTGFQWSGKAPATLPDGKVVNKGDYFWWDGTAWHTQVLPSGDPTLTQPPGVSGPITGQWHAADPDVKVVFDPALGTWVMNMALPAGLHGDALEIKASVQGGYVGIPDQKTWFDASQVKPVADLGKVQPGDVKWATFKAGDPTSATPEPSKVFDPDLTSPLAADDLLEWVHLRITANDPVPMAGGIEGFSYKVEGLPGNVAWTVKDATGTDTPAVIGEYVHWVGGQTNQWVAEGATAANPVGYWEDASAGTMGQQWKQSQVSGWPFTPAAGGAAIPQVASANPAVAASAATVPGNAPVGSVIFTANKLPDPDKYKNARGELVPFVVVVSVSNEDIDNGYPDDYLLLFEYEPADPAGNYPDGSKGQWVPGTDVGLAAGSGNLYLPDGWLYIGKLKGIPGPAGQIRHMTARNLDPVWNSTLGAYDFATGTVVLRGHPSYRDIDLGLPAGLPAVMRTITVHDTPPGSLPTGAPTNMSSTGATLSNNMWDITLNLPRGSSVISGPVSGPASGTTVAPTLGVISVTVAPNSEPTRAPGTTYYVPTTVPSWVPPGNGPGTYLVWDGSKWAPPTTAPVPTTIPASVGNQGNVIVDPVTGLIWISEPDGVGGFHWRVSGSVKGPAGSLSLGMTGVVDWAVAGQTGPLPQQQVTDAITLHSFATNAGSPDNAVIDLVLPRAPRWWSGAVSPRDAGFSLPVVTLPGGATGQVEAQPWDMYLDFSTGNVYLYEPAALPRMGGSLAGVNTQLPTPVPGIVYAVGDPIPTAVSAALPGVAAGQHIEYDGTAGAWKLYVPASTPLGTWRASPIGNVRGPQGPPGPGLRFRGVWNPAGKAPVGSTGPGPAVTGLAQGNPPVSTDGYPNTPYEPGDIVIYNGITYMITQSGPQTNPDGT